MKILELVSYIHLPDDFEGDELDAMEWYIDYRRKEHREKNYHDIDKGIWKLPMEEYMARLWDLIVEEKKTRGGVIQLKHLKDNKWSEVDKF